MSIGDINELRQFLPLRPTVMPGESFADHLIRLFDVNGYRWGPVQLKKLGLSTADMLQVSPLAVATAEAIGLSFECFNATTPRHIGSKEVSLANEAFHRDYWSTERRRWCPACWSEDLSGASRGRPVAWGIHRRFWWSASLALTCPIHDVHLESNCSYPGCGRPIFWYGGTLYRCADGHCLLDCEARQVDARYTRADRYFVGRISGIEPTKVPFLDRFPLGVALGAITQLGATVTGGAHLSLRKLRSEREPEMLSAGFDVALGWPGSFESLLADLGKSRSVGKWGADRLYGRLHKWVKSLPVSAQGEEVRQIFFENFGQEGFIRNSPLARKYVGAQVTVSTLANEFALTGKTIKHYLAELGYELPSLKKGSPAPLPEEVVSRFRRLFEESIPMTELATLLGIRTRAARNLVTSGVIAESNIHRTCSGGGYRVGRAEALAFLEAMRGALPKVRRAAEGAVTLVQASRHTGGGGFPEACKAVLDGRLVPVGFLTGCKGLAGILTTVKDLRASLRLNGGQVKSLGEVSELLNMHKETVRLLVKDGILGGEALPSGQLVVSMEAVEAFKRTYITGTEVAKARGTRGGAVKARLGASGVLPVADRNRVKDLRVSVYRRAEVEECLSEAVTQPGP